MSGHSLTLGLATFGAHLRQAYAFLIEPQGVHLERLDTSWRAFLIITLAGFVMMLPFALANEWLEPDLAYNALKFAGGLWVFIASHILILCADLMVWLYLAWLFGWLSLYRRLVVAISWVMLAINLPLSSADLALRLGVLHFFQFDLLNSLGYWLSFGLVGILAPIVYSGLVLHRYGKLPIRISVFAVALWVCSFALIIYMVQGWRYSYLQSGVLLP